MPSIVSVIVPSSSDECYEKLWCLQSLNKKCKVKVIEWLGFQIICEFKFKLLYIYYNYHQDYCCDTRTLVIKFCSVLRTHMPFEGSIHNLNVNTAHSDYSGNPNFSLCSWNQYTQYLFFPYPLSVCKMRSFCQLFLTVHFLIFKNWMWKLVTLKQMY